MPYPYGMQNSPVVGNGLGGLPRRTTTTAVATVTSENSYSLSALNASPWSVIYTQEQFGQPTQSNISGLGQLPRSVDISPDGKFCAYDLDASPFLAVYRVNNGVFTRLADPDVLPSAAVWEVRFFANDRFIIGSQGQNVVSYKITNNTVTRVEQVDGLVSSSSSTKQTFSFTTNLNTCAILTNSTPFIKCYTQSNGVFTALDAVDVALPAAAKAVSISGDGSYLVVSLAASPYIKVYKRVGNGYTVLTNPASLPTASGEANAFAPDNSGFFEDNGNQGTTFYSRSGDVFTRGSALSGARPSTVYTLLYTKDGKFITRAGLSGGVATSAMWSVSGTTYTSITSPFDATTTLVYWGIAMYKKT